MQWKAAKPLSKWFILFMAIWAILIGEILPVCLENYDCFPDEIAVGGKESMFSGFGTFTSTIIVYLILGIIFWFLFNKLDWKIVIVISIISGQLLEFLVFRPQEATEINVVENPISAFLFFLVIWPILLGPPYFIFNWFFKKRPKKKNSFNKRV